MVLLIPFVRPVFKRFKIQYSLLFFILLSALIEVICCIIHPDVHIYSKFFGRYFFLIFFGYVWAIRGIIINKYTILISIVSLGFVVYFSYFYTDAEPLFFTNISSPTHRWPCYPYMAILLAYFLHYMYRYIRKWKMAGSIIRILSKSSYEIFLVQMAVCIFVRPSLSCFIENSVFCFIIWYFASMLLCFGGGVLYNKIYNRVITKGV